MVATASSPTYVHAMDMRPPAPTMNARLVVMMTADDKKAIEARARSLDLSTSELVRRAAQSYDEKFTPDQEAMLELLADELDAAVVSIRTDLRAANERLEAHFAEMDRLKAGRPIMSDEQQAA